MDVRKIFGEALDCGVHLFLENGNLKFKVKKGGLPDALREQLKLHKSEIIAYLSKFDGQDLIAQDAPEIRRADRQAALPLSYAQQRLWLLDQIDGGSAAYNMPGALSLRGQLDLSALEAALSAILARHESLRTCFRADEHG
ncbi:MAG: hypothetical protein RL748_1870, partial [Pseudomonadota bacterium]